MKTLIIYALLLCGVASAQAQQITELEEATVKINPYSVMTSSNLDDYSFTINENYAGEFHANPIGFMQENFDIKEFIEAVKERNYETYVVTFKSTKGFLRANFNKHGTLGRTYQKFTNILLPLEVRQDLYKNYKGWTMTKNNYVASGNGDLLKKEVYKIKIEKDNKSRIIKLTPAMIGSTTVASN
ncbi:hypothetical protein L1I30_07045 [Gillisia sp. M10.2A]|uniref:GLPGLI family protein n=1 Tax=Gillisia lutea TaxID=2909668 RepID=A0ABS9EJ03_9FLAO|nr:hypothetical protein [Gillisia lutea]MCF4101416.1 hypothetical protein [Gillisia lutea]